MEVIELGAADDGRSVELRPGQVVVLRLPENPTTGYRWEAPAGLALLADSFEPGGAAAGAAGLRVLRFEAGAGSYRFDLRRPWGGGEPERSWHLHVTRSG